MSALRTIIVTTLVASIAVHGPALAAPRAKSRAAREEARRRDAVHEALDAARSQRAAVVAQARALADAGDPAAAATRLAEGAAELDDPALTVEAAERWLAAEGMSAAERAEALVAAAREQLADVPDALADRMLDVRTLRIHPAEAGPLRARLDDVTARIAELRRRADEQRRLQRRARRQIHAGAALTSVGVAGLGLVFGGLAVRADRADKLAAIAGQEPLYDLSSLDAQGRRATAMIAAGVVTATLGLVAGGVLLGHGLRERRGRLARVQVAPTVAGLLVVGRF